MQNSAARTYVQTQFSTMGQGEILVSLYDGALKYLNLAKEKIEEKDVAAKGIYISKAMDIFTELGSSLNTDVGGDLSKNLQQLYFICSTRLLQANLKMDIKLIDSVIDIIKGIRDAYAQIINNPEAQAASNKLSERHKTFDNTRINSSQSPQTPTTAPTVSTARANNAYGAAAAAYGRMNQN